MQEKIEVRKLQLLQYDREERSREKEQAVCAKQEEQLMLKIKQLGEEMEEGRNGNREW